MISNSYCEIPNFSNGTARDATGLQTKQIAAVSTASRSKLVLYFEHSVSVNYGCVQTKEMRIINSFPLSPRSHFRIAFRKK